MTLSRPDLDKTRYFLKTLFDPEDIIEVRCMNEVDKSVESFWWTLSEVTFDKLVSLNLQRWHVWFGVNPRLHKGGSKAKDVGKCQSVCLDLDGVCPSDGILRIRDAGLPLPTLTITSGGGSQYFWRLSRCLDPEGWRRKQRGIIHRVVGADTSIADPPRVMRLPGFRNWKPKYAPTFPYAELFLRGPST